MIFAKNYARFYGKKIILGTSDAWSTIHLSHRPSNPAYYISDWRISLVCHLPSLMSGPSSVPPYGAASTHSGHFVRNSPILIEIQPFFRNSAIFVFRISFSYGKNSMQF